MEFDIERMMLRLIGRVEELEERIKSLEKQLNLQSDCSDSNSDEMPSEIKTNADIRKAVYLLSIQEKITEKEVEQFVNPAWCNEHLHLNFPLLRDFELGRFDENGYPRYWNTTVYICGKEYFICSQWYPHNRNYFTQWLQEKLKN